MGNAGLCGRDGVFVGNTGLNDRDGCLVENAGFAVIAVVVGVIVGAIGGFAGLIVAMAVGLGVSSSPGEAINVGTKVASIADGIAVTSGGDAGDASVLGFGVFRCLVASQGPNSASC